MKLSILLMLAALPAAAADAPSPARPGKIAATELKEYAALEGTRKKIVDEALELAARDTWLRYRFGSAEPESGGLDCSGSVYFVLQQAGIQPPRSSAAQFTWVKDRGALKEVSSSITSTEDAALKDMKPGDLMFWSGTYEPKDGRTVPVSHVQIFLGHEKATGKPVMVGASDGRTYRGTKREGYGVFDFKLPKAGSKAKFLGYGLPATTK
ncbi:NlpC/P60 family protein [Luteolibacter flavescens]|uniref:NlpC/P60 family protein n=1 Tax=Luteolibacter flavescens TaxID=1859460 RepID=A0ABT3FKL0_9BACT|nr:NlpC/P60 family protein [Luteolibacter flavescens]MCW1883791.1 NlpC/P60 family protein [Luteolibacter flavescens]